MGSTRVTGRVRVFTDSWMTGESPSPNTGPSNSHTLDGRLNRAQSVPFQKRTVDTAKSVDTHSAPRLSITEWDGTLHTLSDRANLYLGPDTWMQKWLIDTFGLDEENSQTSKMYRQTVQFKDGQMKLHDVLALAHEWDAIGPAQPREFVDAVSFEVEGTRRNKALLDIMRTIATGRTS